MPISKKALTISNRKDFKFPKILPLYLKCEIVVVSDLDAYSHNPNLTEILFYPQGGIKCVKLSGSF